MSARRSLLTAAAAGALLGALWFVPSAGATSGSEASETGPATAASPSASADPAISVTTEGTTTAGTDTHSGLRLADSGSMDTTPYLVGGSAFLCVGAGFVAYSVRRGTTTEQG